MKYLLALLITTQAHAGIVALTILAEASGFSYRGSMKILDHENLYEHNKIRSRYNYTGNRQTLA